MLNLIKTFYGYALSGLITACIIVAELCVFAIASINSAHATEIKAFHMPFTKHLLPCNEATCLANGGTYNERNKITGVVYKNLMVMTMKNSYYRRANYFGYYKERQLFNFNASYYYTVGLVSNYREDENPLQVGGGYSLLVGTGITKPLNDKLGLIFSYVPQSVINVGITYKFNL